MNGADLCYLYIRDKTSEKLGISSAEAKRLIKFGRIMVENSF